MQAEDIQTASTKRKVDDMVLDDPYTDIDTLDTIRTVQRQRSYSATVTTPASTTLGSMTPLTPSSLRPASSHSHTMSTTSTTDDEDMEDAMSPVTTPSLGLFPHDGTQDMLLNPWALVPPKNFGRVMEGVFRSAFPAAENLSFLKTLGLKTILTLVSGPYPEGHKAFVAENNIQHFQIAIEPNKSPFVTISHCSISFALGVLMDKSNYPILVHCNKGKHRTGCVIGCLRKILGLDLSDILADYHHYADPKARVLDERYLELFDERSMLWMARRNGLLPLDEPARTESPIGTLAVGSRLRG